MTVTVRVGSDLGRGLRVRVRARVTPFRSRVIPSAPAAMLGTAPACFGPLSASRATVCVRGCG